MKSQHDVRGEARAARRRARRERRRRRLARDAPVRPLPLDWAAMTSLDTLPGFAATVLDFVPPPWIPAGGHIVVSRKRGLTTLRPG